MNTRMIPAQAAAPTQLDHTLIEIELGRPLEEWDRQALEEFRLDVTDQGVTFAMAGPITDTFTVAQRRSVLDAGRDAFAAKLAEITARRAVATP